MSIGLTLIIATLAGWHVNATAVDAVIALSVVVVAVVAYQGRPTSWTVFTGVVFGFGLIHGLGLSTRLQDIGLPEDGLLARVIAFNIGIEIGQLAAIAVIVAVAAGIRKLARTDTENTAPALYRLATAGLLIGGAAAFSAVLYTAVTDSPADDTSEAAAAAAACTEGPRTDNFPVQGGHTAKSFFEPTEITPLGDFGHSLADGYVVYLYRPQLPAANVEQLRELVHGPDSVGKGLLAGPGTGQVPAVKAVTATRTLTCTTYDHAAVQEFTNAQFPALQ